MRMARGRAVGDHRHRLAGRVRRVHLDLHVEHRGQAAQALRADAQRVDLLVQLDAQRLDLGRARRPRPSWPAARACRGRPSGFPWPCSTAFSAVPPMPMPSMPGGHQPAPIVGTVLSTQSTTLSPGLSMASLLLFSLPPPLAATVMSSVLPGTISVKITAGVLSLVFLRVELRVGHDRGAQRVVGVVVAAAHAFVDGVVQAAGEAFPAHVHADLQEHVDDAGVLADRPVAGRAHLAVGQDLRDRVLGRRALLALVGARQVGDVVGRVVVADVLQRGGDGFDQVGLLDVVVMGVSWGKRFADAVVLFSAAGFQVPRASLPARPPFDSGAFPDDTKQQHSHRARHLRPDRGARRQAVGGADAALAAELRHLRRAASRARSSRALAQVKRASAVVNHELGLQDEKEGRGHRRGGRRGHRRQASPTSSRWWSGRPAPARRPT